MAHSSPPLSPTSIDHLPVELLESIFAHACVDGGYTGRSVSLVSARFRDVARPIRFQSVALTSLRHIKSFLTCLNNDRADTTVQVRHLFLSTWRDGEEVVKVRNGRSSRGDVRKCSGSESSTETSQWCVWMSLQEAYDKELSRLLPNLLDAVANDLSTLSIVHSWEFGAVQLPANFPLLQDFTFCGPAPRFPGWCVRRYPPPRPCFPRLRHLHVVCWNISIDFWVHHSPIVTHLRLSDLNCAASALVDELPYSIGFALGRTSPEDQRLPPFSHIRLQPRTVPGEYCGTSAVEQTVFVSHLKKLQAHPTIRVEVMQDRRYRGGYWDARIHRDWLGGLASGPGWWTGGEEGEEGEDELDCDQRDNDAPATLQQFVAHWM